jgi:hypothetical protein
MYAVMLQCCMPVRALTDAVCAVCNRAPVATPARRNRSRTQRSVLSVKLLCITCCTHVSTNHDQLRACGACCQLSCSTGLLCLLFVICQLQALGLMCPLAFNLVALVFLLCACMMNLIRLRLCCLVGFPDFSERSCRAVACCLQAL